MAIRAVFFDAGKVLVDYDIMRGCKNLEPYSSLDAKTIYERAYTDVEWKMFELGPSYMTPLEFYAMMCDAAELKNLPFFRFTYLWSDVFTENQAIEYILREMKPWVGRLIISNTNPLHWPIIREYPIIKTYFPDPRQWILSHEVGSRKPDPHIFQEALNRSGVPIHESVFIDDRPENTDGFEKLGGHGIRYDCAIHPPEILEKELKKFGVLV